MLGVILARMSRSGSASTLAGLGFGLFLAIPIAALAVPFTFSNGTTADANQVNANFAAVTPVVAFGEVNAGSVPATSTIVTHHLFAPAFTAPRDLTCVVNADVYFDSINARGLVWAAMRRNGLVVLGSPQGAFLTAEENAAPHRAEQTRGFLVPSGAVVQFGAQVNLLNPNSVPNLRAMATYHCM